MMSSKMKTLIMGASESPIRYAYLAAERLLAYGHEIVQIGKTPGQVFNEPILTGKPDLQGIDTVTLYLNPQNQQPYEQYLLDLQPRRIIFNPGTENPAFEQKARRQGIETIRGCTLVMLGTRQY